MREIARGHGITKAIISDKDTNFNLNFPGEGGLFKGFGKNMNFITTYHP
jgi:hypothetical protein